ncbi:YkoP family protein [Bacillus sp. JJ1562]|uniref:YkoP family protein n=1 Tax=Bacillus sp. JJ1562 TaxID=3122960 RepID=UPI0030020CB4
MLARMKLCVITIWTILDPIYYAFTRLTYVEDNEILRVKVTKYKGRSCVLADGTEIKKNDLLIKIHLHNVILLRELLRLKSETSKARLVYKQVKQALPGVADYLHNHPKKNDIKGIIGITALNKGSRRLGFETIKISNKIYLWFKLIVFLPMYYMAVSNISTQSLRRHPMYLFMSKDTLFELYR